MSAAVRCASAVRFFRKSGCPVFRCNAGSTPVSPCADTPAPVRGPGSLSPHQPRPSQSQSDVARLCGSLAPSQLSEQSRAVPRTGQQPGTARFHFHAVPRLGSAPAASSVCHSGKSIQKFHITYQATKENSSIRTKANEKSARVITQRNMGFYLLKAIHRNRLKRDSGGAVRRMRTSLY